MPIVCETFAAGLGVRGVVTWAEIFKESSAANSVKSDLGCFILVLFEDFYVRSTK
jgi:hypothetical protein